MRSHAVRAFTALLTFLLLVHSPTAFNVASAADLITLELEPAKTTIHVGQVVGLTVRVRNNSDDLLHRRGLDSAWSDYKYHIWDEVRQVFVPFDFTVTTIYSGTMQVAIKPHDQKLYQLELSKHAALDHPGKYRVRATAKFAPLPSSGKMWRNRVVQLTSDVVEITVLP